MKITESQLRKIVREEISERLKPLQESPGGGGSGMEGPRGPGGGRAMGGGSGMGGARPSVGALGGAYEGVVDDMRYYRYLMPNLFDALDKEIRTRSPHLTWTYLTGQITRLNNNDVLSLSRMKELESMYNDGLVSIYDVLKELKLSS
jgi:hypothetical protein